ncbi:amidohydrolase family protein [Dactylosporangium sp. AC04546]|uniref:N-acyl-D-amino-acid deacylase family protein n=1 Tax=Dactylosporangium sp. AC04546 TaxID=2862460 RepID=UPI001EDED5E1|nr:amidohydrolase family protein [Dactylosporangium sp. AC04546]WVK86802.1 amidohydrolase family protein [Dactylosporangium sp. AC04546]
MAEPRHHDLVLTGGTVIDGRGGPAVVADVAVDGDRIAAVGAPGALAGRRTLVVTGKVVSPGFIDIHSHADFTLAVDGRAQSSVAQGITTVVTGNCGHGVAPVTDRSAPLVPTNIPGWRAEWDDRQTWSTFADYLDALRGQGVGVNVLPLVAHGALRLAVAGFETRALRRAELDRMRAMAAEAMDAGAVGLSTGLEYAPGLAADTNELITVAGAVGERAGLYASHCRNRTDRIVEAAQEAVTVAGRTGCRLQLSHFVRRPTAADRSLFHRAVDVVRAGPTRSRLDVFPFPHGPTPLPTFVVPMSIRDAPRREVARRLADRSLLDELDQRFVDALAGGVAATCFLASDGGDGSLVGRSLGDLAGEWDLSLPEVVLEVLRRADVDFYDAVVVERVFDDADLRWALLQPDFLVMGDGLTGALDGPLAGHAMCASDWGYAPQMLGRFVRDERLVPIEQAVARMTAEPAAQLGLADRGVLVAGYRADIVVFDPARVGTAVREDALISMPAGIDEVLVNGAAVVSAGRFTGALPGTVGHRPG